MMVERSLVANDIIERNNSLLFRLNNQWIFYEGFKNLNTEK